MSTPSNWQLSSTPQAAYLEWVARHRLTFSSIEWATVVAKLGGNVFYAWSKSQERGLLIPVFRKFGLKVGFLGFPVANIDADNWTRAEIEKLAQDASKELRLDLVRATRTGVKTNDQSAISGRPESWIENLQGWQPTANKRIRKDLGFAKRAGPELRIETRGAFAESCFTLYKQVITLNKGQLRYSLDYFKALEALSRTIDRVTVAVCIDAKQEVLGFAATVIDGNVGHYLHAAASINGRQKGVSDLLMERCIEIAQTAGCTRFTMMSSPWEQHGLTKFKEKWSDSRGLTLTYDIPGTLTGAAMSVYSRWKSRQDVKHANQWARDNEPI